MNSESEDLERCLERYINSIWKKHPKYQVLFTELNPWQLPSNLTIIPNMSVSDIETQTKCMASYGFLSPFLLRL